MLLLLLFLNVSQLKLCCLFLADDLGSGIPAPGLCSASVIAPRKHPLGLHSLCGFSGAMPAATVPLLPKQGSVLTTCL